MVFRNVFAKLKVLKRSAKVSIAFAFLCALTLGWAFMLEAKKVAATPITSWSEDVTADCAVVLTGGPVRIREGVDLLARNAIQKLIISGVHPQASFREIFPLWPFYAALREENIILERRSRTTYGNAQQSLALVEALRCRDVVLITSRVHMRRALATFRAEFPPEFPLIARAVISGASKPGLSDIATETVKSIFYASWAY